jgi:type I restriction enzyme S subunit
MKFRKETEFQEAEIGRIARDWKVVRLKDVAEIRGSRKITQGSDTLIFIPMEAIPDDGVYAGFELRDANEVKSYVYCEPGDILLAKITPSFENGKQGIVPEEIPGKFALATTEVYPIRCKNINKFFLFYLLKYPPLRNKLMSLMRGTTGRRRVPREALEDQLIPYPPLKEQENIGKVLLTIQNLKESMRDAIVRLERLKRGLMSELLTGRIRVREENGRLSFHRETELQKTEIGKIPREWKTVKLSSIARIIMGQSPPSDTYNREGLGMPFLQGKMEFGRMYPSPTTYTTQPLKIAEPNDILISVRAPVGDVNIAPYKVCIGRGLAAIRFNLKTANHMFYFYYLQYIKKQLETLGKGSTFKAITKKDLEELLIPLPPIKEQEKVSGMLAMIDKTIELYHEERERLDRLKRGLMDLLLTGKVRVVDGDVGS